MVSQFHSIDVIGALPLVVMVVGITFILVTDLFRLEKSSTLFSVLGIGTCLLAWSFSFSFWFLRDRAFNGVVSLEPFTFFFYTIILLGTALSLMLNAGQLGAQRVRESVDVDVLVLLAACGGLVMVSATNLIVMFLGFETLSVAVYVLSGSARTEKASAEGALKYFILGAFSSAFLLYGMVLVFGATGSMELSEISNAVAGPTGSSTLLLTGMALIIFGFAFKVSLVPFHFWAPDAYQGAPVSITTFMAVVVKSAAFGAFIRILATGFPHVTSEWVGAIAVISGLTMTVGNLVALRQKSLKRMLAYSSIAHAGYILMGFVSGASGGWEASLFYVVVYSVMTVASFGVVLICTAGGPYQYLNDSISSFRGLGWRHPGIGIVMSIALLSLAGLPPLAGFFGKFYLFAATVKAGYIGLAILAALNSVVSLYYYLSVLVVMYFSEEKVEGVTEPRLLPGSRMAVGLATAVIIFGGVFSARGMNAAKVAVASLVAP
ncbi:MAG: NADH-quinone oxidoreductase subunit N, partial [Deltaproteobacteria bacterium]|nr:NADH-quinone oxidoreductase subunit N [Deltaproteobacteria bacterium]